MDALKRKAPITVIDSITLSDGTQIEYIDISVEKETEIQKTAETNKRWSEFEKNLYIISSRLRVNGKEVCVDDLKQGFSVSELMQISEMIVTDKKKEQ
jgi:hypothetical protein